MLNVLGTHYTRGYQEEAMQSRLKIPLLFAHDVIHGYLTTFPVPLAEAASFDLAAIERRPVSRPQKPRQPASTGPLHRWWM
jgi:beta-glucosidase